MADIPWRAPWRPITLPAEIESVQRQLEREIGPGHPLCFREPLALGRRFDRDDVVVVLSDGTYANVSLTWSAAKGRGAGRAGDAAGSPAWFAYGDRAAFIAAMIADDDTLEP